MCGNPTIPQQPLLVLAYMLMQFFCGPLSVSGLLTRATQSAINTPKFAVFIAGLEDRFLYKSKVQQVVLPAVAAGYGVDVYVSLVASGYVNNASFRPAVYGAIPHPEVPNGSSAEQFNASLRIVGGNLVAFFLLPSPPEVESSFPPNPPIRLWQYPVNTTQIGKNVLRRFKAIESLMEAAVQTETDSGKSYDFVLLTRDDDFWMGPLDLPSFAADPNFSNQVYSKGCKTWGGLNEKTLLFGREAADRVLGQLYSDFWARHDELVTYNVESFVNTFIRVHGARSVPVEFNRLPTCDSVYNRYADGSVQLCQRGFYLCPEALANTSQLLQPNICPMS